MTVKELNENNFDDFISKGNAVVDFSAEWCGPCKMMEPEFKKASDNIRGVKFGKVNIEDNQELAGRFYVMTVPTTIFFKDKEPVDRESGAMSYTDLEDKAGKHFN